MKAGPREGTNLSAVCEIKPVSESVRPSSLDESLGSAEILPVDGEASDSEGPADGVVGISGDRLKAANDS